MERGYLDFTRLYKIHRASVDPGLFIRTPLCSCGPVTRPVRPQRADDSPFFEPLAFFGQNIVEMKIHADNAAAVIQKIVMEISIDA